MSRRPPLIARALLRLFLPSRLHEAIAGDLEEQWHSGGERWRYWKTALQSVVDCWRYGMRSAMDERVPKRGDGLLRSFLVDARYSARTMIRNPGFSLAAVLTLAIGIGSSTAIFSTVNPTLFEPLPYPESGRVMSVCDRMQDGTCLDVTFGTYRELLARNRSFEALSVFRPWQPVMTGTSEAERLEGQRVTADYFQVLGIQPVLGRDFDAADDRLPGPRVVILSDGLWRRRFANDMGMIGREIALGDDRYTVIGIMPRAFQNVLAPQAEVWTPLQYDPALPPDGKEWGHHLRMAGRLRPDVSVAAARQDLEAIARSPLPEFARVPWASLNNGLIVRSLQDELTQDVKPALLAFSAAVLLVLAIASANVTNLLLARAVHRQHEFAMRAALGAGRSRLARQLLTEGLLLAVPGGILGVMAAQIGVDALVALSPPGLPRVDAIAVDGAALAFALGVTILVGIGVAVLPALHTSRGDVQKALRHNTRTAASGPRGARQALVVAEVALALVLLVGAGLLFRSLGELLAISPGFSAEHVRAAQVQMFGTRFHDEDVAHRLFAQVVDAVGAIPGVSAGAVTSQLPLSGDLDRYGVQTEYAPNLQPAQDGSAFRYSVSPGYFETMAIPLRRGRLLDARDRAGAQPVVVISESFARRRFAGVDPIGQRLHVGPTDRPWYTVVGVVGDIKQTSLGADDADAVYMTPSQWHFVDRSMWIVVRSTAPEGLSAAIRAAVRSVDRNQPIVRETTMPALLAQTTSDRRFALVVSAVFGGVALVLAITGLYGALARSVTERTREIGVRAALGASRVEILAMIVRQGLTLTGLGVVLGILAAVAATRMLETMLFATTRVDPLTYAAVTGLFAVVAAVACCVPAARAVSIDPAITLRAD